MLPVYLMLSAVVGYLLGSISVSVLVSKLAYKGDLRNYGSGNAGATNMARVYGLKGGLIVLIGDFAKALLAWLFAYLIGGENSETCVMVAGIACVLGHAFPIFFKFKGGKGVTVGAAVALMVDWKALLFIVIVFVIVFIITRIVSISSVFGAIGLTFISVIFFTLNVLGVGNGYFANFNWQMLVLSVVASVTVVALHHQNLARLARGEEKKFSFNKEKKDK